jgi:probable phosphoglycerate mutase
MDSTRIYIVRHGQTEENKQKIIQGHLDTLLNPEGERQAGLVAEALKAIPFDACYSSDLRRAADTANRILVNHPRVKLQTQEAVREQVRRGGVVDLVSMLMDESEIAHGHSSGSYVGGG